MQLQNESGSSCNRSKWTQQQIQTLRAIYEEQILEGKKGLWNRITKRVNERIRKSSRQAIEYKWKNYCRAHQHPSNRIHKNQALLQELIALLPYKGYSELANTQTFYNITESNLKNIFYSNIRSLAKYIIKFVDSPINSVALTSILTNRPFLKNMIENHLHLVHIRKNVLDLKQCMRNSCQNSNRQHLEDIESKLKQEILNAVNRIKQLYESFCIKKMLPQKKNKQRLRKTEQQQKQSKQMQQGMIHDGKSPGIITYCTVQENHRYKQNMENLKDGMERIGSFNSFESFFNDF